MLRITRPAQMTYHIVGMQIDEHTRKKQNDSQQGMRFQQIGPAIGIQAFGSEIEQTARLHHPVQKVEDDTHRHNSYRHPAFTFQQERKNKGPLKIVQLKQQEEEIYRHGKSRSTLPPQPKHDDEYRRFHKHPRQFIIDGDSPRGSTEHAITRFDKIECNKDNQCHSTHYPQKYLKSFLIHSSLFMRSKDKENSQQTNRFPRIIVFSCKNQCFLLRRLSSRDTKI